MLRTFLRRRLPWRWARIPETDEDDFGTHLLVESQTVDNAHGWSSSYEPFSPHRSMAPPTQTTKTRPVFPTEVLSEGCVSRRSSSTGSSDAVEADSEKADNVCFAKYCDSCQKARMSSDYGDRILNLMKPLYCVACRKERPSILFSYSSRREASATRVCIGLQPPFESLAHRHREVENRRQGD